MHELGVSITEYVSDEQPGWVRCSFVDAAGREWRFVEKVPVVSRANLTRGDSYPQPGRIRCRIISRSAAYGRPTARIDMRDPWGIESVDGESEFEVFVDQLTQVPDSPNLCVFAAKEVGIDRGNSSVTVGFARDSSIDGSGDAFLLQRSSDPSIDQPGIAGVYIEVPVQKYATYDGITEATLRRDSFEVRLSDEAAARFGGISGFQAEFSVDDAKFEELRRALRFVFRDCDCYIECT